MTKAELRALAASASASAPITRVKEGEGLGLSNKEWGQLMRDPTHQSEKLIEAFARKSTNDLINERHVHAVDHMGRSHITNGLGELIAVE